METDCSYYFLSDTAIRIWKGADIEGQNRMFECLYSVHKASFFRQVIFKKSRIPEHRLEEFAETAFLVAWESFNERGKAGKISLSSPEYTGFFFWAFKNNYLKLFEKELKRVLAEKEFGKDQPETEAASFELKPAGLLSPATEKVLLKISPDCRQLLTWRYMQGVSHDEIAKRKAIARLSSIKMISRCKKRFLEIWRSNN
ncbi:MAG: hypothetical protein P4L51_17045 [Puia sp.]|nr:hypothetical protein [Puia sp.]